MVKLIGMCTKRGLGRQRQVSRLDTHDSVDNECCIYNSADSYLMSIESRAIARVCLPTRYLGEHADG